MAERAVRSRVDPDLRRQFRIGDERDHRPLGQVEPLVEARHGHLDVVGREEP